MKLKPNTSYDFSKEDYEFVIELAKVGHVHLLSNQVALITEPGYSESSSLTFKDNMGDRKSPGLVLPPNWCIEWIGGSEKSLRVIFGVKKDKQ
jgi:hypothetical protein